MRKKQSGESRTIISTGIATLFVLLFFANPVHGASADEISKMRVDKLIAEANLMLETKRSSDAIPYLIAYLDRVKDSKDDRVLLMAQDVRFKLGSIYLGQQDSISAVATFKEYVNSRPALQWREAMKLLSVALLNLKTPEAMQECLVVTTNALAGPPPDVLAEIEADIAQKLAVAKELQSGAPPVMKLDKYGEIIKDDNADNNAIDPSSPSGYSVADLLVLNMNLGLVYLDLDQQAKSIVPFNYVIEHTSNSVHKGFAIMQVVKGLIKEKQYDQLTTWITKLYRTDARYDIRVNIAMKDAASALYESDRYDDALMLYRMVLPRNILINYQSKKIRQMQIKLGILPPDPVEVGEKISEKESLFGKRYDTEEVIIDPATAASNKPPELIELEELVGQVASLPPYEDDVAYHSALIYDKVSRPWEATRFFDRLVDRAPESEIGKRSFYEMIRLLINPLGEYQEAETRGLAYLEKEKEGLLPRQIAYLLCGYYQTNDRVQDVKKIFPYVQNFVASDDPTVLEYDCELYYMQAVADMVLGNYKVAKAEFETVLSRFPKSKEEDNATYWHAVTLLFLGQYEEALIEFNAYPQNMPRGDWIAASIFQAGVCLFSLERYDEAFDRFTMVIQNYPNAQVYPDACSLRGDIYGSQAKFDEAIADYNNAIRTAKTPLQARYAVFQLAGVYENSEQYDQVIQVVTAYLEKYGDNADIATGIYWIGKTKINQGLIDDAVQNYLNAIVKYGTDIAKTGVDSMIGELVGVVKTRLTEPLQKAKLKNQLNEALANTDNVVLQLRLRATLAQIDGRQIEFGKQLIKELPNLDNAAPPVLSAICEASFEMEDYSRAEEILAMFKQKFDESEFIRSAYKLRGYDLYRAGEYEADLALIKEVQDRYAFDYDVAWAQLMKGKILIKLGRYDEASAALKEIFNVPSWRGETYGEATFLLGQTAEAAGDYLTAHSWYQRTYYQYKGYANGYWAAEGYLGSARCLGKKGLTDDMRNTYRAMLFDKYVRDLPQASEAVRALGAQEALEIKTMISSGVISNVTVSVDTEGDK